MIGIIGTIWGLLGIFFLISSAIYRLSLMAITGLSYDLHWNHWLVLLFLIIFMAYTEGYKGFQQQFSPRTVARARYLKENPNLLHSILAPVFCMGFIHATRKRKITSFALTTGIILLIITVRFVPQPWRGIIDIGVIIGLGWGLVSLFIFSLKAFTSPQFNYSPEIPNRQDSLEGL